MGSLSLIIVLIIIVWVIVLAPMVLGNSKPIRRSGEGFNETRVLHSGGSAPITTRRRPKFTSADVHRFDEAEAREDYEVLKAEPAERQPVEPVDSDLEVDGEVVEEPQGEPQGGSTAVSVLREEEQGEEALEPYAFDETYVSAGDYGYPNDDKEAGNAVTQTAELDRDRSEKQPQDVGDESGEESSELTELTEDDVAFAQTRLGRGGWDPAREKSAKADRFQRRQRTLLGLIVADVLSFVVAYVFGGWAWVAPALTITLTVLYMIALRNVVRQERALHERRVRQLRRARLGVVTDSVDRSLRRPGGFVVAMDDDSPDFEALPSYVEAVDLSADRRSELRVS
ncbi:hypothetical protein CAPI_07465 [Corynebacterium capitovis DSM 44611]|uniref:divisome protein SepX/GlpR n=1 Tax=Corynebacterium capitovis TaxID=131081 RepID=UPI0003722E4C|nr:gephyrin-like molybdotransferase receptor GlpR [Corynebacterium capitovis]WKD58030.1 hypothetical protein CAPI_07465 [Corynebacterium capitovis DSM 44611]